MAIGLLPMMGFAAVGDGGEQRAMIAMILDGFVVVSGLGGIVISALAWRGNRRAGWIGVILSGLCAAIAWVSESGSLDLFPSLGLAVVFALPAIYLFLGLRASGAQPARPVKTVKRVGE